MQIPKKIINTWKSVKEWGDVDAIAKKTGKNQATISRILSGKQEASPETIQKIVEFLKARKKQISKIEQEA